ncbi:MAG TPA: J domain-containing protein [Chthoniobacterales bacterium]
MLIDSAPLRARVAEECSEAMGRLDRARTGWHHFERKDKPAFARWRAREFGALLSKAREVEIQIRDYQALIHEVEMEMRRGFQDAHRAYQRVMFHRANPTADPRTADPTGREDQGAARKLTDFEKESLFQDWVKRSLGTNPDKMDDEAYSASFEAFKSHMFRPPAEEQDRPRNPTRQRETERPARPDESDAAAETPGKVDARVKELYRRLVRRLHPDLRADGSAAVSALWHEVQEAYAAGDVARMEILLALSDIEMKRTDDQSLSQMRAVRVELQRALQALEKSLLEAEGEDAWDFARIGPSADLRRRVERELKSEFARRSQRLELLTRTIADWARGPVLNSVFRVAR